MVQPKNLEMTFEEFENEFGSGDAVRDSLTIVAQRLGDSQDQVSMAVATNHDSREIAGRDEIIPECDVDVCRSSYSLFLKKSWGSPSYRST